MVMKINIFIGLIHDTANYLVEWFTPFAAHPALPAIREVHVSGIIAGMILYPLIASPPENQT